MSKLHFKKIWWIVLLVGAGAFLALFPKAVNADASGFLYTDKSYSAITGTVGSDFVTFKKNGTNNYEGGYHHGCDDSIKTASNGSSDGTLYLGGCLDGNNSSQSIHISTAKTYSGAWVDHNHIQVGNDIYLDNHTDDNDSYQDTNQGNSCDTNTIDGFPHKGGDPRNASATATITIHEQISNTNTNCVATQYKINFTNQNNYTDYFIWADSGTITTADGTAMTFVQNNNNGPYLDDGSGRSSDSKCVSQITADPNNPDHGTLILRNSSGNPFSSGFSPQITGANFHDSSGCKVSDPIQVNLGDTANAKKSPGSSAAANGGNGNSAPSLSCDVTFNPLTWVICPAVQGMVSIVGDLDNAINSQLSVGTPGNSSDPNQIFCDSNTSTNNVNNCEAYHSAWSSFRDIALGLLAVISLVIIISEMAGLELLDAYTLRKVLPRLIFAAIAITLSWQLMQFFVTLTNDLGYGIRFLIYQPFVHAGINSNGALNGGGIFAAGLIGVAAIIALGVFGLLSFAATAALAVSIAFLTLIVRQILIIILIIMAPIAIIAYVLPNTQRAYRLWWESFSKALLMFPLIAAFIAAGRVFAAVADTGNELGQLMGFVAYFAPYFMIPLTFKFAGAALGQIGGFINDRNRGVFDRLRKGRQERVQDRVQRAQSGKLWNPEYGRFGKKGRSIGGLANFAAMWASAPHQMTGYELGRRGVPGLKRYSAGIQSFLNNANIEQSDKLYQRLNSTGMFNDKAYRALTGSYSAFDQNTQNKLFDAGFINGKGETIRAPKSLKDIDQLSDILLSSGNETERIAGNALQGSRGVLSTLNSDPEMMRANLQAVGAFGLASHGFASGEDLAQVANSIAGDGSDKDQVAFAQQVGMRAAVMGQSQRPDIKAGYGLLWRNGQFIAGTRDAARTRGLLTTVKQQDWLGAKAGAVQELAPHIKSLANEKDSNGKLTREAQAMRDQIALGAYQYSSSDVSAKVEWNKLAGDLGIDVSNFSANPNILPGQGPGQPGGGQPPGGAQPGAGPGAQPGGGPQPPATPSDRRLKRNITYLQTTENGIALYRFQYIWSNQAYVGVMAQDLLHTHPEVLSTDENGFYRVNYELLGIEMLTIEEWLHKTTGGASLAG